MVKFLLLVLQEEDEEDLHQSFLSFILCAYILPKSLLIINLGSLDDIPP